MLTLDNFYLRAVEKNDLQWIKNLRNDQNTWPYLHSFLLLNDYKQEKWFEMIHNDNSIDFYSFGKDESDIGLVRISEIDRINQSMCVGGDILPKYRGRGYGKWMYKLILKLGFDLWNMNRLWLLVMENNHIALNLYQKMGFKKEGILREMTFRNGKYINSLIMSILKYEYQEIIDNK